MKKASDPMSSLRFLGFSQKNIGRNSTQGKSLTPLLKILRTSGQARVKITDLDGKKAEVLDAVPRGFPNEN